MRYLHMDLAAINRICICTLTVVTTAFLLILATGPNLLAYDDSMPGNGRVPAHARDIMRAFAAEHHHDQQLSAQSITACVGGFAASYPCSNVDLMAFLPLSQIGGGNGNDIWGWTDSATGDEYAIMGLTNGTAFVDISDPVNPVYLGHLPAHSGVPNSSWRDIKTYKDHAFIGSEAANSGMQVMDLTQLLNVSNPPVTFVETAFYLGFSSSHDIVINEDSDYAYAVGLNNGNCARGLHFVDIFNPTSPQAAGCFNSDGYTHDAQCVNYNGPDTDYQGREICFAYNVDTLTIVDVSDKTAPVQISRTGYPDRSYTHQGWLTEDQAYLLMGDEGDELKLGGPTRTLMWDVANLDAPSYMGFHSGTAISIDHNQFIVGNYSYQANYRSGLRILDISDIANANLVEVGFFDIYPANDSATYSGAWGVYPFFASGNVIVSGIEQGLYILRPNLSVVGDPPVVDILNPVNSELPPLTGVVPIRIHATDTEDADNNLAVEWNVDGGAWQPAVYFAPDYLANWDTGTVLDGAHVINARAVDSDLREGNDASSVTTDNGTPQFTVDSINVSITVGKGNRNTGNASLMTSDEASNPLGGVAVEVSFSVGWSGIRNDTTDGSGEASFKTPKVKNLTFIQLCVNLALKAGWSLDIDNSTLCGNSDGGGSAFGTLAGQVTDMAGDGISEAAISIDSGQFGNSDNLGDYFIENVPVGNRNVAVTASSYDGQNKPATVSENATTIVDFALDQSATGGAGSIKGTVYLDGSKLGSVTLKVLEGSSSMTNKGGKYSIQNVSSGWQTVTASTEGFQSQQKTVEVLAGGNVTLNFTFATP